MQEFKVENNDINTNLIYELKENEAADMVAIEMIQQNSNIPGLLKMIYTQNNSLRLLKYNITSKITLQQLLERNVTKKVIISVLTNTIRTLISADEYLLEQDCFVLDMEKIYVDLSSYEVGMIYLPLKMETKKVDYSMFFKNLILISKYDATENCEYVAQIISYLNSASFSLVGFYDYLHQIAGLKNDSVKEEGYVQSGLNNMSAGQAADYKMKQGNSIEDDNVKTIVDTFAASGMTNNDISYIPNKSEQTGRNQMVMPGQSQVAGRNQMQVPGQSQAAGRNLMQVPGQSQAVGRNQMQMSGQPQAAGRNQMQVPGQSQIAGRNQMQVPGQNQPVGNQMPGQTAMSKKNEKANKKEKKKSKLFGGKSEKNNKNMNVPNQNAQNTNVKLNYNQAIHSNNMSVNGTISNNMLNNSIPNSNGMGNNSFNNMAQYNMGMGNVPQNNMPGFGETTVLGNAYSGETTVLNASMNPNNPENIKQAYLIREKNGERIPITKEKFLIGKEKSFVDYFIADNTAISRSHAYIINHNNEYYIVDTNSKNHTYINGKLITPNTEVSISNDCKIKLADEEFIFSVM